MRRLLLTSQGMPEEEDFRSLLAKPPGKISVSYITTAAFGDNKFPAWLEVYRKQLRDYGINDIEDLDIKNMSYEELNGILARKDIIFVNGGNTFYLLYWAKKSGFDKLIPAMLDAGKLYIGVSAGSYIACPTIEQAAWKHQDRNHWGLTDLSAMNLVPFLITAHYKKAYKPIIEDAAKSTSYPIVTLNDKQAILVEGNHYKLIGDNNKAFFNGFKEKQ